MRPTAKMLMAVPLMTWSTLNLMESTARTAPRSAPLRTAAISPSHRLPAALATTTPTKAPVSSMPSIPMLMTADRSHHTPLRADRAMGVAA